MSKTGHMNIEESELRAEQLIERREYHEAERLLTSLLPQGSVYAPMALAWIYEHGYTGNKDTKAAKRLYEQAVSRGNIDAALDLGLLLLKEGRKSEAEVVFEKGAEEGNIGCSVELGWMLANEVGDEACRRKGREILEVASNKGHLFAKRRIISLDLSEHPSLLKRVFLAKRLLVVAWKTFFEAYRNSRSNKIW